MITYSDVATQTGCPGSSNVVRTWKATDACGNSNTCTQTITYQGNAASLCGAVLRDCNADGILTGEAGLSGVAVMLKIPLGLAIATNTTDASGGYCFNNLAPGTYTVVVTPPASYTQTADPDSTKDNQTAVTLISASVGFCTELCMGAMNMPNRICLFLSSGTFAASSSGP